MSDLLWRQPAQLARDQRVFREELDDFVPDKLVDFHLHVYPQGTVSKPHNCGGQPLAAYDFATCSEDFRLGLPGRQVQKVCFGMPFPEANCDLANAYLRDHSPAGEYFPLRTIDPVADTPAKLAADLATGRFYGIKPYPNFVPHPKGAEPSIPEMLPDWAMTLINDCGGLVMLHIPRKERLGSVDNQREIRELALKFPKARIVIAHLGRAYYLRNIVGQLELIRGLPNLWYDFSMVNHWEVMAYAFRELGVDRILFGSDAPIVWAPGKSVEINHQYSYVTPHKWELAIHDSAPRVQYTSFMNEELRAMRKACETLGYGKSEVRRIFNDNAQGLLAQRVKL